MAFRSLTVSNLGLVGLILAMASCGDAGPTAPEPVGTISAAVSTLTQVASFGSNPGGLQMFTYVPASMPTNAPLVFALHGCTESASVYQNAGWNALADTYKFYLVYPQQTSTGNPLECFNWAGEYGNPADITRGEGEAESVNQMVSYMKSTYSVDASRVFMTGFSAGAAYAVALLAMYPDVFAGGASFSGLPFGCANSVASAETCQSGAVSNTAAQWGTFVKSAFPGYAGPYPRLSLWQGSSDTTVNPANLTELVDQWTDVAGLSQTATATNTVGGFPHDEYADSNGVVRVETYSITGMSHAVAIDPTGGCGTADTYDIDEKVCAVGYVAKFLGLEGSASSSSSSGSGGGSSSGGSGGSSGGGSGGSSSGGTAGSSSGSGGISGSSSGDTSGSSGGSGSGGGGSSGGDQATAGDAGVSEGAQQPQTLGCSVPAGIGASRLPAFACIAGAIGMVVVRRRRRRLTRS
jgi:poly(hydroxyalkanoate) depolymerase family esterase